MTSRRIILAASVLALVGLLALPAGAAEGSPRTFATPEAAADGLRAALVKDDLNAMIELFGPTFRDLIVGSDPALARAERRRVAALSRQNFTVLRATDRAVIAVGDNAWLFPIPLAKRGEQWSFDTAAGVNEVRARRVGRGELDALTTLDMLVAAQLAYARRFRDANKPVEYARYIQSTPGKTDGLWWDEAQAKRDGVSPLAKFVAAQQEFLEGRRPGDPFRGYYFRILTAQGHHAPRGTMSYADNGRLAKGFAFIAWPAAYKSTGVMTFLVAADGLILEKDLGEDTGARAAAIRAYDPDASWRPAR